MKRTLHRLIAAGAVALALAGCGSMQQLGAEAAVGIVEEVTSVLTGPDTDYKNYVATCLKEYKVWIDFQKERGETTRVALASPHKEIAFSAFVQFAVEGAKTAAPKCSVERKPGWMENTNIFDLALRAYEVNTTRTYARKKLESDERIGLRQIAAQQEGTRRLYDLIITLSGDKLELNKEANRAAEAATTTTTAP